MYVHTLQYVEPPLTDTPYNRHLLSTDSMPWSLPYSQCPHTEYCYPLYNRHLFIISANGQPMSTPAIHLFCLYITVQSAVPQSRPSTLLKK